jgi:hypothetical protein
VFVSPWIVGFLLWHALPMLASLARLHAALVDHYRAHGASPATLRLLEEGVGAARPTAPPGDTHAWVRDALGPRNFLPAELD